MEDIHMTDINSLSAQQISERLHAAGFQVQNNVTVAPGGSMTITHVSISVFGVVITNALDHLDVIFGGEKVRISTDYNNETINIHPIK